MMLAEEARTLKEAIEREEIRKVHRHGEQLYLL